jgi:signal transduction histidine kinase
LAVIDQVVNTITYVLVGTGLVVILIALTVSLLLSRTLTIPIRNLTSTAEKMAKGNFAVRANKRSNDELGKLADTLNFMANEVQRNNKLKNEFISSVSHELRTPLTSIKGWAVTLQADATNRHLLNDGLEIIEQESDRLTDLLEELLDFSKLEAGRLTLHIEQVDVHALLQYMEKQITPRAQRQGIAFLVNIHQELPKIQADENRLKQVLINVLDNALKFTSYGGRMEMNAAVVDKHLHITVSDSGEGISPEDLAHVMEKFYKGKHKTEGSGLGLAISRDIIELHGGKLTIDSAVGQGTKVGIRLPL